MPWQVESLQAEFTATPTDTILQCTHHTHPQYAHTRMVHMCDHLEQFTRGTQQRKQQALRGQRNQRVERGFMTVGFIVSQTDECVHVVGGEGNIHTNDRSEHWQ
jgi:hypothetical protein